MEKNGGLFALVMRADGAPIGYSFNYLTTPIHYSGTPMAINDAFFVAVEHRAAHGLRLMRATREAAQKRQAQLLTWYAKPGTALEAILQARHCRPEEIVYIEELA